MNNGDFYSGERRGPKNVNVELEESLIGAVLHKPSILARSIVRPEQFGLEQHQLIWAAMLACQDAGEMPDVLHVGQRMHTTNRLSAVGGVPGLMLGADRLSDIRDDNCITVGWEQWEAAIIGLSRIRALRDVACEIVARIDTEAETPEALSDFAEQAVYSVSTGQASSSGGRELSEIIWQMLDEIAQDRVPVTTLPTGFRELDRMILGIPKPGYTVIAADSSIGKSTFTLNVANNVADAGHRVALFSLEMSERMVGVRAVACEAGVDMQHLRGAKVSPDTFAAMSEAQQRISSRRIHVDSAGTATVAYIRRELRRLALTGPVDLVVVDYLQLVPGEGRTREREVATVSQGLRALAKEFDCAVVVVAAINNKVIARKTDKRPENADIRESGDVAFNSDLTILLYRDEVYNPDTDDPGVAEAIVSKQRNGPCGTVRLGFIGKWQRFTDLRGGM